MLVERQLEISPQRRYFARSLAVVSMFGMIWVVILGAIAFINHVGEPCSVPSITLDNSYQLRQLNTVISPTNIDQVQLISSTDIGQGFFDFTIDGHYLLFGESFGVHILDLSTGEQIAYLDHIDVCRAGPIFDELTHLVLSHDNNFMLTASNSFYGNAGSIKRWNLNKWTLDRTIIGNSDIDMSYDDRLMSYTIRNGTLHIIDLNTFHELPTISDSRVGPVAFSPTHPTIAYLQEGLVIRDYETDVMLRYFPETILSGLRFSPDGLWIAAWTFAPFQAENSIIYVVNLFSGAWHSIELDNVNQLLDVIFSPDSSLLVSANYTAPYSVSVWDVETSQKQFVSTGRRSRLGQIAFSPDGKMLVSNDDDYVMIWDVENGSLIREILFDTPIIQANFSPSGTHLVIKTIDGLQIWAIRPKH